LKSFDSLEEDGKKEAHESFTDQEISAQIDDVLENMDKNRDGYVSYYEFATSNRIEPKT
jgi:Ca2+-binding EF-hand superfamily protein